MRRYIINGIDYSREPDSITWGQFEQYVHELLDCAIDQGQWEIHRQCPRMYIDGGARRLDWHITEKRQGGIAVVVDAKHFRRGPLPRREIDDTEFYRRQARARQALIVASYETNIPLSVSEYSKQIGVKIIKLEEHINMRIVLKKYFDYILTSSWENRYY